MFDLDNDDEFLTEHYSSSHTGANKHIASKDKKTKDLKGNNKVTTEHSRIQNKRNYNQFSEQSKPIKSRYDLGINKVSNVKLQEKITKIQEQADRSRSMTINKQVSQQQDRHREKRSKYVEEDINEHDSAFEDAEDDDRQFRNVTNLKIVSRNNDVEKHEKTFKISRQI